MEVNLSQQSIESLTLLTVKKHIGRGKKNKINNINDLSISFNNPDNNDDTNNNNNNNNNNNGNVDNCFVLLDHISSRTYSIANLNKLLVMSHTSLFINVNQTFVILNLILYLRTKYFAYILKGYLIMQYQIGQHLLYATLQA